MIAWTNFFMNITLPERQDRPARGSGGRLTAFVFAALLLAIWPAVQSAAGTVEGKLSLSTGDDGGGEILFGSGETVRLLRPDFARERDELRRRILPRVREADRSSDAALVKLLRSASTKRRELEKSYREAVNRRQKERREYEAAMDALIPKFTVASTKADDQGRFRLTEVAPGKYLILTQKVMRELGLFYHWLVEVEVGKQDPITVELTRKNATSLYY